MIGIVGFGDKKGGEIRGNPLGESIWQEFFMFKYKS